MSRKSFSSGSSSSSSSSSDSSDASVKQKARAALQRIIDRSHDHARKRLATSHPHPTSYGTITEENSIQTSGSNDMHNDLEAQLPNPFLYSSEPGPEPEFPSPTPYSDSSSEVDYHFIFQGRQRRHDLGPREPRSWWEIDFDDWTTCISIYLMGCLFIMALGAASVWAWLLLRQ
jgi:hypothetical protein